MTSTKLSHFLLEQNLAKWCQTDAGGEEEGFKQTRLTEAIKGRLEKVTGNEFRKGEEGVKEEKQPQHGWISALFL